MALAWVEGPANFWRQLPIRQTQRVAHMQLPLARPSACKQLYQRVNLLHDKVLTSRLHSAYLQQLKIVSLFRQDQSNPLRIVRRRRALCRAAAEEDSAAIAGTIRKVGSGDVCETSEDGATLALVVLRPLEKCLTVLVLLWSL